jgi:hypothetical protein
MNGGALIRYHAAKAASAAAPHIGEVKTNRDKAVAMRHAGNLLLEAVVQAPSLRGAAFVLAPAIIDIVSIYTDLAANGGITITVNVSGATGNPTCRAAYFVRHHQRHHHRGINSHGLSRGRSPREAASWRLRHVREISVAADLRVGCLGDYRDALRACPRRRRAS